MKRLVATTLIALAAFSSCADESFEVVADAGSQRYDVGRLTQHLPVRVDEVVETDIFVPARANAPASGPFPIAVIAQGGAVDAERYQWIGEFLARRGVVSIVPHFKARLAFFSQGDISDALRAVREDALQRDALLNGRLSRDRAVAIGHSLGGVVAGGAWLAQPDRFRHGVILASFPIVPQDFERNGEPGDRLISVVGGSDPRVSVEQASEPLERLDANTTVLVAEGVSHFQFADGLQEGENRDDGTPEVDLGEAHRRIGFVLQTVFEDPERFERPESWPQGVVAP